MLFFVVNYANTTACKNNTMNYTSTAWQKTVESGRAWLITVHIYSMTIHTTVHSGYNDNYNTIEYRTTQPTYQFLFIICLQR